MDYIIYFTLQHFIGLIYIWTIYRANKMADDEKKFLSFAHFSFYLRNSVSTVLEFYNNLWGLGTEKIKITVVFYHFTAISDTIYLVIHQIFLTILFNILYTHI
jgi:hypothetical protein